jgi:adenosylhomocysteine nucleosidase
MATTALTGLAAEASLARRCGIAAAAGGGDPARTADLAGRLLAEGADRLLSFGLAGALAPALPPGAVLLPQNVRTEGGDIFPVDAAWHARARAALAASGIVADERDLLGADRIIGAVAAKAAAQEASGAVAVDLESHIVASAARRARRPFLVLRAVADPASLALPAAASVGLDREGRIAPGPVLRSLLRRPGELGDLIRLARYTRTALSALRRALAAIAETG